MGADQTETTISSERVYDGRVVNLRVDTVQFPNGNTGKREVVEHSGAVAVVAMPDRETVLLVRQWRTPIGRPLLEIVAGGIEEGEDPATSALRELREEIGYTAARLIPLYEAFVAPGYCTEKIYGFLALDLTHDPKAPDADENVETVRMTLQEALTMVQKCEIEDAKTIAGLTLAERVLAKLP